MLNPRSPAPVGGRACTGHYVPTVIFGAMQQVLPERVMAGAGSPLWIANLSGTREDGRPFATVLFYNGGLGATGGKDGASGHVMAPAIFRRRRWKWPNGTRRCSSATSALRAGNRRCRPAAWRAGRGDLLREPSSTPPVDRLPHRAADACRRQVFAGGEAGACGEVLINGTADGCARSRMCCNPGDEVISAHAWRWRLSGRAAATGMRHALRTIACTATRT